MKEDIHELDIKKKREREKWYKANPMYNPQQILNKEKEKEKDKHRDRDYNNNNRHDGVKKE